MAKQTKEKELAPDRIQVKLTVEERQQYKKDWDELEPDLDWANFCRKMLRAGIKKTRETNEAITSINNFDMKATIKEALREIEEEFEIEEHYKEIPGLKDMVHLAKTARVKSEKPKAAGENP